MIGKNVKTDFSSKVCDPVIDPTAYVHPLGAVIGNVIIGKNVFVAPFAAVRGDEGQPLPTFDRKTSTFIPTKLSSRTTAGPWIWTWCASDTRLPT